MTFLREWWHRLGATIRGGRSDEDLAEELRAHAAMAAAHGHPDAGAAQAMEAFRDQRGVPWIEVLVRDLRYGARLLGRTPGFTIVAVVSLALGIGANAAIFHLIDAVRLRSLPVANPGELVEIRPDGNQAYGSYQGLNARATYPLWQQLRASQQALSSLAAWGDATFFVGRGAGARPVHALWVSGDLFNVLGVVAERGRLIADVDDRRGCGAGVTVISHAFWQSHFGGSESVIGQTVTMAERQFTVIGVTPPGFTGLEVGQAFDVALPTCSAELWGIALDRRDLWWLSLVGRLKPGWTLGQASAHFQGLSQGALEATVIDGYNAALTEGYRKLRFSAIPAGRGVSRLRGAYGTSLSLLLGLTALLLLITCGNLATLLLARAGARERELTVRAALGASRRRLVLQMFVESLLLAGVGGVLAVPVAVLSSQALVRFLGTAASPLSLNLATDWRLIAFIAAVAALTAFIFGCLPAVRVSFVQPGGAVTLVVRRVTLDRHRARFQRGLVAFQVAVSLVLIVSAFSFIQTFRNLASVPLGFGEDGTVAVTFYDLASRDLPPEQKVVFQQRLNDAIRAIPGVLSAASSTHVPLASGNWSHFFRVRGVANDERRPSRFAYVDPEYFRTLGIPVVAGRGFRPSDTATSKPVIVINESFVRNHLVDRDPIGAVIDRLEEPGYPPASYEVVGVVGDTKYADMRDESFWYGDQGGPMPPIAYVPLAQNPVPYAWWPVIVHAESGTAIATAITEQVQRLNPDIAVDVTELKTEVRQVLSGDRMTAWLAGAFGALAILLVAIGLHGLIAYLAVSRTSEIGIRLSLGSTRSEIVRLVLRDSVWMIAIGVAIGVPSALLAMRAASALLFGLSPTSVPIVTASVIALAVVAAAAGALPAWRASRLDPAVVLRAE